MLSSVRSTAASGTWFLSRVRAGNAHTNGMESHWAMFKRAGSPGVYHHVSVKHLPRYTTEFEGRDKPQADEHRRTDGPDGAGSRWQAVDLRHPDKLGKQFPGSCFRLASPIPSPIAGKPASPLPRRYRLRDAPTCGLAGSSSPSSPYFGHDKTSVPEIRNGGVIASDWRHW